MGRGVVELRKTTCNAKHAAKLQRHAMGHFRERQARNAPVLAPRTPKQATRQVQRRSSRRPLGRTHAQSLNRQDTRRFRRRGIHGSEDMGWKMCFPRDAQVDIQHQARHEAATTLHGASPRTPSAKRTRARATNTKKSNKASATEIRKTPSSRPHACAIPQLLGRKTLQTLWHPPLNVILKMRNNQAKKLQRSNAKGDLQPSSRHEHQNREQDQKDALSAAHMRHPSTLFSHKTLQTAWHPRPRRHGFENVLVKARREAAMTLNGACSRTPSAKCGVQVVQSCGARGTATGQLRAVMEPKRRWPDLTSPRQPVGLLSTISPLILMAVLGTQDLRQ